MTELLERGHTVRLLSRHASQESRQWPTGVDALDASITDPASLAGAADGCEAVIHLAAIVAEDPPEQTFEEMNVEGTRHVVEEAERAGVEALRLCRRRSAPTAALRTITSSKLAGEKIVLGRG